MVANLYEALLQELGRVLGVALFPDANNSCLVRLRNGLELQIELDKTGDKLIVGADLSSIPPGRYREAVLREALMANGLMAPRPGVFAFSRKADRFVLFRWYSTKELNGEKIAFLLGPFTERALAWKQTISRGEIPHVDMPTPDAHSGLFGLKR